MSMQELNQAAGTIIDNADQITAPVAEGVARSASTIKTMFVGAVRNNKNVLIVTGAVAVTAAAAYGGYKLFKRHQAKKAAGV